MGRDSLLRTLQELDENDDLAFSVAASAECRSLADEILKFQGGEELIRWLMGTETARSLAWRLAHDRAGRDLARHLLDQHKIPEDIEGLPHGLAAMTVLVENTWRSSDELAALCAKFVND